MLLRGISENVFRTGSEIVIMMQSNQIDIVKSIESQDSYYLWFTDFFYLIQNAFPTLIGLIILAAYYYFGANSA